MPPPPLVAALAYDRLCTFEFGCVVELFALPRPELDVRWYESAARAPGRAPLGARRRRYHHPCADYPQAAGPRRYDHHSRLARRERSAASRTLAANSRGPRAR